MSLGRRLLVRNAWWLVLAAFFVGVPWVIGLRPSALDRVASACHDKVAERRGVPTDAVRFEDAVVSVGKSTGSAEGIAATAAGRYAYSCETTVRSSWVLWGVATVKHVSVKPLAQ